MFELYFDDLSTETLESIKRDLSLLAGLPAYRKVFNEVSAVIEVRRLTKPNKD